MSIQVSKQGWQYRGGQWNSTGSSTYIGRESMGPDMTEFIITPDTDYSSLTLSFSGTLSDGTFAARWGTSKPSSGSASGTAITANKNNSITVTGDFPEGQAFSIFVWSGISQYKVLHVTAASATGTEDSAVARVYHGDGFEKYEAQIYTGGAWTRYEPYVYDNGEWRKME